MWQYMEFCGYVGMALFFAAAVLIFWKMRVYDSFLYFLKERQRKKNMKWMIASDLHGSAYYVEQLLEAFQREQADRLLLLGDLLYHGPRNALPEGYETKDVASQLNAVKDQLVCVRGNCDSEVDQMVLDFPIDAEYCLLCEGDHMIFATHGHRYSPTNPPALRAVDILLERGFCFVTVEQLMALRGVEPESGETYRAFPPEEERDKNL